MPDPHLAINGYFLDNPHSGSGQYLLRLLEQLDDLWSGPVTALVPVSSAAGNVTSVRNACVMPVQVP